MTPQGGRKWVTCYCVNPLHLARLSRRLGFAGLSALRRQSHEALG
jgi:hypothetical protein